MCPVSSRYYYYPLLVGFALSRISGIYRVLQVTDICKDKLMTSDILLLFSYFLSTSVSSTRVVTSLKAWARPQVPLCPPGCLLPSKCLIHGCFC